MSSEGPVPSPRLGDREFRALQSLVYEEAGIALSAAKKPLVAARLARRLRALDLPSFGDYHRRIVEGDAEERVRMLDCLTTNETRFFREPAQFELIRSVLVPRWQAEAAAGRRARQVRVWSAGCSSGEEPYTLAMVLLRHLPAAEGWTVEIEATDLSTAVLRKAEAGLYGAERAADVPLEYRREFLLRGVRSQEGLVRVTDEARAAVRFQRANLMAERLPVRGPFDAVLCRNVLIYFDQQSRARVLARLVGELVPGGHLFLGHAESLNRSGLPLHGVAPNVYRRDTP
jgi:chemotaxis protein methyltransferase CheR